MQTDLDLYRESLGSFLTLYLEAHQNEWRGQRWAEDVLSRLSTFCVTGKLSRGCLLLHSYHLFSGHDVKVLMPLAAAVECMQSSLLIHDDIIDQDLVRRGQSSIPAQYRKLAQEKAYSSLAHAGESLALCVGDIGFFLGFELLSQLQLESSVFTQLLKRFAYEYQVVGLGEMDDVHLAFTRDKITAEEIIEVYRSKTARYSLVMPMQLAAIVAQADPILVAQLESILEKVGLIFQIKDDELGIFGTEAEIGKPVTSDVREGKKTLYYFYGMSLATGSNKEILTQAFGNPNITLADLENVKVTLHSTGAVRAVEKHVHQLQHEVQSEIQKLGSEKWYTFLSSFLKFNVQRKH